MTTLPHTQLALAIARHFLRRLPAGVLQADIEQAALIGLWDGLRRQADRGEHTPEQLRAYLSRRIRGSIVDELRRQDWASRRNRYRAAAPTVVRFDDIEESFGANLPAEQQTPEEQVITKLDVATALRAPLLETDRRALVGVVMKGRRQYDVARELGMSDPRVSQRMHRALNVMRAWLDGDVSHEPDDRATLIPKRAHLAILEEHANREHRRVDREPGKHPARAASAKAQPRAVRGDRLGGSPAAPAHRSVSPGTRAAELASEARDRLLARRARRSGPMTPQQKQVVIDSAERVALRLRRDIAQLRAQGYDELQIAAELGLDPMTVRAVLSTQAPLRKCGP